MFPVCQRELQMCFHIITKADYHLESLPLQSDDDSHSLRVQLDELSPLMLTSSINAGCRLRAELQISGQDLQLKKHTQTTSSCERFI